MQPELRFPSFIIESMNPHDWNNIPLPMVAALDTFKRAFIHSEKLYLHSCKENKTKTDNIVRKFKEVSKN